MKASIVVTHGPILMFSPIGANPSTDHSEITCQIPTKFCTNQSKFVDLGPKTQKFVATRPATLPHGGVPLL